MITLPELQSGSQRQCRSEYFGYSGKVSLNAPAHTQGIGMTSARTRERLINRLLDNGITNQLVLDRVRSVPRHLFVQEALASRAYEDDALPIGFGQTISQPLIVALMTQALLEESDGSLRKMKKGFGNWYWLRLSDRCVGAVGGYCVLHRARGAAFAGNTQAFILA